MSIPTAIHRAFLRARQTWCGIRLRTAIRTELLIPTLRPREGKGREAKIVTVDGLVNCRACLACGARADARADIAADEKRAPVLDHHRRPARGSPIERAIADDAAEHARGSVLEPDVEAGEHARGTPW